MSDNYSIACFGIGFPGSSTPFHRHMKFPISSYHSASLSAVPIGANFGVDRFLLPSSVAFSHFQNTHHRTVDCLVDPTNPKITSIPPPNSSSINSNVALNQSKRKRSWSRAVFSQLQRKGLEIQFQIQKYITKPDRRKLAARLGLTDAQVCSRKNFVFFDDFIIYKFICMRLTF